MDFIMRACKNAERARVGATLVLALVVSTGSAVAVAEFKVAQVRPTIVGRTLALTGRIELGLPAKVEEALNNGIPLEFAIDIKLTRHRTILWDLVVAKWTLRRELRYHALSGQYLVSGTPIARRNRESFMSLSEALNQAGALDDITFELAEPLPGGGNYRVEVRVVLDIEALPPLLRPVAYTTRAWDLNSGWTIWKTQE